MAVHPQKGLWYPSSSAISPIGPPGINGCGSKRTRSQRFGHCGRHHRRYCKAGGGREQGILVLQLNRNHAAAQDSSASPARGGSTLRLRQPLSRRPIEKTGDSIPTMHSPQSAVGYRGSDSFEERSKDRHAGGKSPMVSGTLRKYFKMRYK